MALVKCPECGREVSSSAQSCQNCGYPIQEHVKERELEIKRLTEKILPCEFTVPEPRAKVCIKCAEPFQYVNPELPDFKRPSCLCGMPGVEIDYTQVGLVGWETEYYAFKLCCEPRNIGDQESEGYKAYVKEFADYEAKFDTIIKPKPPDPENFGVDPEKRWYSLYGRTSSQPKPEPLLPHCPFCQSTNLTKISSIGKAIKISLFGLYGMEDAGKTYRCNNCGGKF